MRVCLIIISLFFAVNLYADDKIYNLGLYDYEFRPIYSSALKTLEKIRRKNNKDKFILALAYLRAPDIDSCFFDPSDLGDMLQNFLTYNLRCTSGSALANPGMEFYITKKPDTGCDTGNCLYYEGDCVSYNKDTVDGLHNIGMRAYDSWNYKKAYKFFEKAAEKGFVPSKIMLAVMYLRGFYVARSIKKSVEYFKEVVSTKDVSPRFKDVGLYVLGNIYAYHYEDYETAKNYFLQYDSEYDLFDLEAREKGINNADEISGHFSEHVADFVLGNYLYQKGEQGALLHYYDATFLDDKHEQDGYPCLIERANYMWGLIGVIDTIKLKRQQRLAWRTSTPEERKNILHPSSEMFTYSIDESIDSLLNALDEYRICDQKQCGKDIFKLNVLGIVKSFMFLEEDWGKDHKLRFEYTYKAYAVLKTSSNWRASMIQDLLNYCSKKSYFGEPSKRYPILKEYLDKINYLCADTSVETSEMIFDFWVKNFRSHKTKGNKPKS